MVEPMARHSSGSSTSFRRRSTPGSDRRLNFCIGVAALLGLLHCTPAAAVSDWYASIALGTDYANKAKLEKSGLRADFDRGWPVGGGAIGARVTDGLFAELEVMRRVNDFELLYSRSSPIEINPDPDDKVASTSVMANLRYEFRPESTMRPFLGAGLGWARIDYQVSDDTADVDLIDDRTDALAYQIIAGFTLEISPRLDLTVSYHHWRTEEFDLETESDGRERSQQTVHSTLLGLRYTPAPRVSRVRSGAAQPQPRRGPYLSATAGAGFAKDAEIEDNLANFDAYSPGPFAAVAFGYDFRSNWRVELEASARRNDVDLIDFNPEFGEARAGGDIKMRSLIANLYYDFSGVQGFQPHFGAGFGVARGTYDVKVRDSTFVDDEDTAWAGQVMVGATSHITDHAAVTVGYRAWMGGQFKMQQPDGRPLRTEQIIHTLHVGLRYDLR